MLKQMVENNITYMYCMSLHNVGAAPMLMFTPYASFQVFTVHCIADADYKHLFKLNA